MTGVVLVGLVLLGIEGRLLGRNGGGVLGLKRIRELGLLVQVGLGLIALGVHRVGLGLGVGDGVVVLLGRPRGALCGLVGLRGKIGVGLGDRAQELEAIARTPSSSSRTAGPRTATPCRCRPAPHARRGDRGPRRRRPRRTPSSPWPRRDAPGPAGAGSAPRSTARSGRRIAPGAGPVWPWRPGRLAGREPPGRGKRTRRWPGARGARPPRAASPSSASQSSSSSGGWPRFGASRASDVSTSG